MNYLNLFAIVDFILTFFLYFHIERNKATLMKVSDL